MEAPSHPSVRALLRTALDHGPAYKGHNAQVYHLPGLDDYVLRVERGFVTQLRKELKGSSTLTPVDTLVADIHTGQSLMTLDGSDGRVTLLRRQPGISLADLLDAKEARYAKQNRDFPRARAWIALDHELKRIGRQHDTNPFEQIFDQGYDYSYTTGNADLTPGNILIDRKRGSLGLVDQPLEGITPYEDRTKAAEYGIRHQPERFLETERYTAPKSAAPKPGTPLGDRYHKARASIGEMLDDARDATLINRARSDAPKGLTFRKVTGVEAIALDAPPHTLRQALDTLTRNASIPTR